LEGTEAINSTTSEPDKIPADVLLPTRDKAPAYPTSSKNGPKNWEKLAGEEKDDEEEGDEVNGFFKKLYKGADDDTKRAMMKSYQESNGTALSTSWGDVGSKTYETTPPDGMEAKKWEK
jgi:suppressor of G2 allele of SKP1